MAIETRKALRELANSRALGGMRDPASSLSRLPNACTAGGKIRELLLRVIPRHESVRGTVASILQGQPAPGFSSEAVADAREAVRSALDSTPPPVARKGLQPDIFAAYCKASGDPDWPLSEWILQGAPLGATREITRVGVFPADVKPEKRHPSSLKTLSLAGWHNYRSAEQEPDIVKGLLQEMLDARWSAKHSSLEEAQKTLPAGKIKINKLGLVSKQKPDGSWKHRLVWDLSESGVNEAIDQGERTILPRPSDLTAAAASLHRTCRSGPGTSIFFLGIDISDAFHQVPNHPEERHLTAVSFGGEVYLFFVLVFGSTSAPTVWGRFAAWLGRSTMAVCEPHQFRMLMYVDDPVYTAAGTSQDVIEIFSLALLWAAAAGFPLAWHKADGGTEVVWIGALFRIAPDGVEISVPPTKVAAIQEQLSKILKRPLVSLKHIRALAGVLSWVATIVPHIKPFLSGFWSALAKNVWNKPIATKFLKVSASWLDAFLRGQQGGILVTHRWCTSDRRNIVRICTDASPYGMGGVLIRDGRPKRYFSESISEEDRERFAAAKDDPRFITVWESLAILIALRLWLASAPLATRVEIKSDSLATVKALEKGSSRAKPLNEVIREIALAEALRGAPLPIIRHIPGMANAVPDALSRLTAPVPSAFPETLQGVIRSFPQRRGAEFWPTSIHRQK